MADQKINEPAQAEQKNNEVNQPEQKNNEVNQPEQKNNEVNQPEQKNDEQSPANQKHDEASQEDFGAPIVAPEIINDSQLTNSRISVLYNASSMFECALAATLKCEKAVAALPDHSDHAIIAKDIRECNPHVIIILGTTWPDTLFLQDASDNLQNMPLVLILCDDPTKAQAQAHVLYIEPALFNKLAPCKSEISAYMIFSHLMRGEFSRHFKDGLEEARYFRIALRSSINSTLEAFTFVEKIISNWQQVMDPENLVLYGKFLTSVIPNIAQKRIAKHSVLVKLGEYTARVIECTDFEEVMARVALEHDPIIIIYSLSADTTQCYITCRVQDDAAIKPCEVLSLVTPVAEFNRDSDRATCATNDFFAIIRASIIQQRHNSPELGPTEKDIIAKGEKILQDITPLLEGKN